MEASIDMKNEGVVDSLSAQEADNVDDDDEEEEEEEEDDEEDVELILK